MVNRIILVGNIGKSELKYTKSGNPVLEFSLAVNEKYKKNDGTFANNTTWLQCNIWGSRAEKVAEFHQKGRMCYVEGSIKQNSWEDKHGQRRTSYYVNVSNSTLVGNRSEEKSKGPQIPSQSSGLDFSQPLEPNSQYKNEPMGTPVFSADDIPF